MKTVKILAVMLAVSVVASGCKKRAVPPAPQVPAAARPGAHTATVAAIRKRMDGICVKIPAADSARGECDKFLAKA